MIPRRVKRTIRERCLLDVGQRVVVAVSGGADSVALLHALHKLSVDLKLELKVAHLNHGLRGSDSDEDAAFVARLSDALKLDCVQKKVNVSARARRKGISLEMAGREARYAFFRDTCRRFGADAAATAHTADDQAETVLLKMARGAGTAGLGGIRYQVQINGLKVVRPLLDVTRKQIVSYLHKNKWSWREDESNRDTAFLRNRVRQEVLPFMESKLNPGLKDTLIRTADLLREEDAWLDGLAHSILRECRPSTVEEELLVSPLTEHPLGARRRVLRLWLALLGVGAEALDLKSVERVEGLLRGRSGRKVTLGSGWCVSERYGRLRLVTEETSGEPSPYRVPLPVPGETVLSEAGLRIAVTVGPGIERAAPAGAGRLPARASVSRERIGRKRVYVRSWRSGDRMRPIGLRGSKKIHDIFVDDKVPRDQRGLIPLFECDGEIIWIPGYRVAREWAVRAGEALAVQLDVRRI